MTDTTKEASWSMERRIVARWKKITGAKMYWDVQEHLKNSGWKLKKKREKFQRKDEEIYQKRYGGIWMTASVDTNPWGSSFLLKAPLPKRTPWEDFEESSKKLSRWISYNDLSSLDRHVKELLAIHKEMGGTKRRRREYESFRWKGQSGKEGYRAWLAWVQETLVEALKRSYEKWERERQYFPALLPGLPTRELTIIILDDYEGEPLGYSRKESQKTIRRVLDSLAKRGKILKDTNNPRMLLWEWVP
jgi:hypothetical protein